MKRVRGLRSISRLGVLGGILFFALFAFACSFIQPDSRAGTTLSILQDHYAVVIVVAVLGTLVTILLELRWVLVEYQLRYLAAEVWNEAGPSLDDYKEAFQQYHRLLSDYDNALSSRRIFRIGSSPSWATSHYRAGLRQLQQILTDAAREVESVADARKTTLDTAQRITILTEDVSERYSAKLLRVLVWLWRGSGRSEKVKAAIVKFTQSADIFFKAATFDTAKHACLNSRSAGALIHGCWPEIKNDRRIIECIADFESYLDSAIERVDALLRSGGHLTPSQHKALVMYRESMVRRLDAVRKLRSHDFVGLSHVLTEAIVTAREREVSYSG